MAEREIVATVELSSPIEFKGEPIEVLEFRDATGADIEDMPAGGAKMGDLLRIASRLTNVPLPFLKKLNGRDAMKVAAVTDSLFVDSPATGDSKSPA